VKRIDTDADPDSEPVQGTGRIRDELEPRDDTHGPTSADKFVLTTAAVPV
jgi:hypothetical protein